MLHLYALGIVYCHTVVVGSKVIVLTNEWRPPILCATENA